MTPSQSYHSPFHPDLIGVQYYLYTVHGSILGGQAFSLALQSIPPEADRRRRNVKEKYKSSGDDPFSLALQSIVGADMFHFSVRNGKRWYHIAKITKRLVFSFFNVPETFPAKRNYVSLICFTSLFGMARFAELLQRGEEEVVPYRSNHRKAHEHKHS